MTDQVLSYWRERALTAEADLARLHMAATAVEWPPTPMQINGVSAVKFVKHAYGLGYNGNGPGRFDLSDPVQTELRHIKGWIEMAAHDALQARTEQETRP